jgi:hypothetical protein
VIAQRREQSRHLHGSQGRFAALVALAGYGALERLLD